MSLLVACFKAFWQSTAAELFGMISNFKALAKRLEFTFQVVPLTDPTGEPGPYTGFVLATLVFGETNNAQEIIYSCRYILAM